MTPPHRLKPGEWTMLPKWPHVSGALKGPQRLRGTALAVFLVILDQPMLWQRDGIFTESQENMAKDLEVSERRIRRVLRPRLGQELRSVR